jgi:biotin carboxyl carrier protein
MWEKKKYVQFLNRPLMNSFEIGIADRIAKLELVGKEGNDFKILVDGKICKANIIMVERGVYSVLMNGRSYNVELFEADGPKRYEVNTFYHTYDVEIIDAESKYLKSRQSDESLEEMTIASPMPGKVVKIPVKVGDKVHSGDTVIIVSAMKMESEYKVKKDRIIKDIKVKEGDTISANQPLIIIE